MRAHHRAILCNTVAKIAGLTDDIGRSRLELFVTGAGGTTYVSVQVLRLGATGSGELSTGLGGELCAGLEGEPEPPGELDVIVDGKRSAMGVRNCCAVPGLRRIKQTAQMDC